MQNINWLEQLILFVFSFPANLLSSLAGGGAGLVQFPILIFLGLPFGVALATHKIASVALGLGAMLRHWREKHLERNFSLFILLCGIPGVVLGAFTILDIPEYPARVALGLLTIGLGTYSFLNPSLGQSHAPSNRHARGYVSGGLGLFIVGILNGSLASGTGLFATMLLVRWFGVEYKRAVAYTLILVGFFWNGSGAVVLGIIGNVRWDWLPALLVASALGGYAGAHLATVKGNRLVKRSFEVLTLLVGLKLLFG